MIKGALLTIGILAAVGGFGWALLTVFAAGMSDSPQAADAAGSEALLPAGIGVVGVMIIVACVL